MDRRSFIKRAGVAGALTAGLAPAVHAQSAVRWRLAHSFPKSLDTIYGTAETFAKLVEDMSGGKFKIQVFAAGEIVPALATLDGVQNGVSNARIRLQTSSPARTRPLPSMAFHSA